MHNPRNKALWASQSVDASCTEPTLSWKNSVRCFASLSLVAEDWKRRSLRHQWQVLGAEVDRTTSRVIGVWPDQVIGAISEATVQVKRGQR